jgi:hypothetical protein
MQLYRLGMVALLAALPITLVACGGDDDSGAKDNGSSSSSTKTATSKSDDKASSSSSGNKEFQVSYDIKSEDTNGTMVLAFKGKKTYTKTSADGGEGLGTVIFIDDGSSSYACTDAAGQGTCLKGPSGEADSDLDTSGFFPGDPGKDSSVKKVADRKVAGRDATCYDSTDKDNPGTVCIDKKEGIVLLVDSPDQKQTATEFKTTVSDDLFKPPYKVLRTP